jgi:hypothetical protein
MALIDKDAPNFVSHYEGVSILITSRGLAQDSVYFVDAGMNGFKVSFQIMSLNCICIFTDSNILLRSSSFLVVTATFYMYVFLCLTFL